MEGNKDIHLLNFDLRFLLVHLEGLRLRHLLNHAHLALRDSTELDGDGGPRNQLHLPLLDLFNVFEGDFLGKRLVALSLQS